MTNGVFQAIRQRHITSMGRTVTYKRGEDTASIKAFFDVWNPDDLAPPLRQGDVRIDILDSLGAIDLPPRNPDLILTPNAAYSVVFANPVYEADTLIGWVIAGRGA
jgi:hypothetical protein